MLLDRVRLAALFLAALPMALIAGFFYAYACSVMVGFARLDAAGFIVAMQAINDTARNGVFAFSFFGSLVFTGAAALLHLPRWRSRAAQLAALAFLTYALGGFLVTFAYNVPLNEALGAAGDLDAVRRAYVEPWTRWNAVRTAASTFALLTLCAAIYHAGRDARRRGGRQTAV